MAGCSGSKQELETDMAEVSEISSASQDMSLSSGTGLFRQHQARLEEGYSAAVVMVRFGCDVTGSSFNLLDENMSICRCRSGAN